MKLWMSSESGMNVDHKSLSAIRNAIEKQINYKLALIEYVNDHITDWDIIIIRDDEYSKEIFKYSPKKKSTDFRLKLEHNEFERADETTRKQMIYNMLLRSLDILEEKNVTNLDVVREIVISSKKDDISDSIEYFRSIQVNS